MGLGPGGVYPGNRGGGPAAAGKVLLLFLPQYAGGGDYRPAGVLPGSVPATTEKIRKDIEKTREKIAEQQKRLRALEAQLTEEENLEIVRMVKAVRMDNRELTAFLRAYASGMISLPDGLMETEESEGAEDDA